MKQNSVTAKRTANAPTVQMCVVVPAALRRKVSALARSEDRSLSKQASLLIERGLRAMKEDQNAAA